MELKQKVMACQIGIGVALVLGIGGYFTYFFIKDTLPQPPVYNNTRNLFIAKIEKDIDYLKNTDDWDCKKPYNEISFSLKEDALNGFISSQEYATLDKSLNNAFVEQFIAQGRLYFVKTGWESEKNKFITDLVDEIKSKGFVEKGSPNWNILSGFKDNVSCYNEMLNCINKINAIYENLNNYIPVDRISDLKNQKGKLVERNCVKNSDVQSKLIDSYENLEKQSEASARLTVEPTSIEFDASGGSRTITVKTNIDTWSYSTVYSWLSISKSGSSLTISCKANSGTNERTDYFHITAWKKTQKINIAQKANVSQNATGSIDKVWTEYNVFVNGVKGMKIHVKFSVEKMLNKKGTCVAWFYFSDGTALKDTNGKYRTTANTVATHEDYTPNYDNSTYSDFVLFMPLNELHLSNGSHSLKFKIGIIDDKQNQIAYSEYNNFTFTQ